VAGSDGLARAEAMVAAVVGHAAIEAGTGRGLDKPFGLDFAITEFGLPVRQAEFAYGLVIRVMPDAAVPINRFCCGAAGDERNGKQQNGGQGKLHDGVHFHKCNLAECMPPAMTLVVLVGSRCCAAWTTGRSSLPLFLPRKQ